MHRSISQDCDLVLTRPRSAWNAHWLIPEVPIDLRADKVAGFLLNDLQLPVSGRWCIWAEWGTIWTTDDYSGEPRAGRLLLELDSYAYPR